MEMPPPSAQDRRPPRRPRQPAARRLAPSRGRPPARGGAGALAEGRRRRRLRGLTKPTRRRSATYSTARVVMETHQLKPAAIGSVRASSEEGGGARRRRPTRGRREDGGRGPFNVSGSKHHPARPRPRAPPGPAAGLRTRTTPQDASSGLAPLPALRQTRARARRLRAPPAASRPSRPCGGPAHAHEASGPGPCGTRRSAGPQPWGRSGRRRIGKPAADRCRISASALGRTVVPLGFKCLSPRAEKGDRGHERDHVDPPGWTLAPPARRLQSQGSDL